MSPKKPGLVRRLWSASCAFGDVDNDGHVDLFVTNYVDFSVKTTSIACYSGDTRVYCHPNVYNGVPDILYRNNGDGTFSDVSRQAGNLPHHRQRTGRRHSETMTATAGRISTWRMTRYRTFFFTIKEKAFLRKSGYWPASPSATMDSLLPAWAPTWAISMATDCSTSLSRIWTGRLTVCTAISEKVCSPTSLSKAASVKRRCPSSALARLFFDYDNDTDLDLAIANGDVIDNVSLFRDSTSYEQRNLLLQNDGTGKFKDVGPASGPGFALKKPSRSLSAGDIDNDGDLDLVIGNVGQTADVLRNDGGNRRNSLLIRTIGTKSNRDGIGARLKLTVNGKVLLREVKAGSSYLSQSDLRVHFGMGQAARADNLEIRWPSGAVETVKDVEANQILTITEGRGITGRTPFHR